MSLPGEAPVPGSLGGQPLQDPATLDGTQLDPGPATSASGSVDAVEGVKHVIPRRKRVGKMPKAKLTWKDGSQSFFGFTIPRPLAAGGKSAKQEALAAARAIRHYDGILRDRYGRAGWDDKGGDVEVWVNERAMGGNAYMSNDDKGHAQMGIGTRDATFGLRKSMAWSPSIIAHEYTHAIVAHEIKDVPKRLKPTIESRGFRLSAVNESIADVLSAGLLGTGWKNGAEIRAGEPIRDMAHPSVGRFTKAVRKDAGLEEHTLSGITSKAAVIAAGKVGDLAVADAWYAAIDRHYARELRAVAAPGAGRGLGAWVRATMHGAEDVGGVGGAIADAMRAGWEAVGLGQYATTNVFPMVIPKKKTVGEKGVPADGHLPSDAKAPRTHEA